MKRPTLQNKWVAVLQGLFGPEKFSALSRNGPQILWKLQYYFVVIRPIRFGKEEIVTSICALLKFTKQRKTVGEFVRR